MTKTIHGCRTQPCRWSTQEEVNDIRAGVEGSQCCYLSFIILLQSISNHAIKHVSYCNSPTRKCPSVSNRFWRNGTFRNFDTYFISRTDCDCLVLQGLSAFYGDTLPDEERFKLLDAVLESGCNYWDSADIYGDSEDLLGKWYVSNIRNFLVLSFMLWMKVPTLRQTFFCIPCK